MTDDRRLLCPGIRDRDEPSNNIVAPSTLGRASAPTAPNCPDLRHPPGERPLAQPAGGRGQKAKKPSQLGWLSGGADGSRLCRLLLITHLLRPNGFDSHKPALPSLPDWILLARGVSATPAQARCRGVLCSWPLRRESQAPNRLPATIVLVSWVCWRCCVKDRQSGAGRFPLKSRSSGPARCLLFQERLYGLENDRDVLDRVACQR